MSENGSETMEYTDEIKESLVTIRSIEMMGYFLEEAEVKLKWARGIFHCMEILRQMHDQLVAKLPPEVIDRERSMQGLQSVKKEVI